MKWSPSQAKALDAIATWLRDPHRKPTFYLAGLAGSGKSTILKHAIQDLKGKICFCAPTGKAALVMQRKGLPTANTIHSLIYTVSGGDPLSPETLAKMREEMKRLRTINEPGAQLTADRIEKQLERAEQDQDRKGPRFALNQGSSLATAALGVVDECSMVDDRIGQDLESFGVPLLVVGDPAQLPPVYGTGYFTSREPDAYLDEIHRQALDSPILRLADLARRGEQLPVGQIGEGVDVRRYGDPSLEDRAMSAEMILVGRNRTRHACNHKIRRLRENADSVAPVPGERVVCLRNDHELGLLNGSTWVIDRCVPDLDKLTAEIEITATDAKDRVETTAWLHPFMAREDELVGRHDRRSRSELAYGYALTVHKCVSLDTLVETDSGLERIDEISDQGMIATHEGLRPYRDRVVYATAEMWRITTQSGYTLDTTANHGVYAFDVDHGYCRKTTDQLVAGATLQFLLEPVAEPSRLAELPPAPETDVRARRHVLPTHVTADVAEWLGLMVGDGTVFQRGIRLAKRHLDVVDRFDWLCRSIFGVTPKRGKTLGTDHVEVCSTQIASWCASVGGLCPNQKAVPRSIRLSPLEIQARFLRGLFEDGTVNLKEDRLDHVEWSSCQEGLAREVQVMLLRFGIISSRRKRDEQWLVYIYGFHAHLFRDRIGFVSSFKNQRLFAKVGLESRYRIPLTKDDLDLARTRFQKGDFANARAVGYVSRETARRYLPILGSLGEGLRYLHDRVTSVERRPDAPSACVTVPSLGRFLQNGSPQANSQGSQFDDVLLFDESKQFGKDARRHLYTGVTRAARTLTVVTQ